MVVGAYALLLQPLRVGQRREKSGVGGRGGAVC